MKVIHDNNTDATLRFIAIKIVEQSTIHPTLLLRLVRPRHAFRRHHPIPRIPSVSRQKIEVQDVKFVFAVQRFVHEGLHVVVPFHERRAAVGRQTVIVLHPVGRCGVGAIGAHVDAETWYVPELVAVHDYYLASGCAERWCGNYI